MNSDSDMHAQDEPIRRAMTALPFPETPRTIAHEVRRRVHQRHMQRRTLIGMSAVAALLFLALILSRQPWNSGNGLARHDAPTVPAVGGLDARTLDSLFALPPVDSLAVLDRRLDVASRVLNAKEKNR